MRNQFATSDCAIGLQALRNQFASAAQSMRNGCAITALQSLRNHRAAAAQSQSYRFAITA
jgi:hypothetical protein